MVSKQQELARLLDENIAENYDKIVAHPDRTDTYASIADRAKEQNDPVLEAWARERDKKGKPAETPEDPDASAGELQNVGGEQHVIPEGEQPHVEPAPAPALAESTPQTEGEYEALTIPQLKELAEQRGVDVSGAKLKGDYIDALIEHATNPATAAPAGAE